MNILKGAQYIFVWAKVLNHEGKKANGQYITTGINRKNPLAYIVLLICAIIVGLLSFKNGFVDTVKNGW